MEWGKLEMVCLHSGPLFIPFHESFINAWLSAPQPPSVVSDQGDEFAVRTVRRGSFSSWGGGINSADEQQCVMEGGGLRKYYFCAVMGGLGMSSLWGWGGVVSEVLQSRIGESCAVIKV